MEGKFFKYHDDFDFRYLTSNSKLRRLGYLKVLLSMFEEAEGFAIVNFNKRFENVAVEYEPHLLKHKNTKGIIKNTKNGTSAAPYVELALKLELIIRNAFSYQLGKKGIVYLALKKELGIDNNSPFDFSEWETAFFLELILKDDYWFIYNILEWANNFPDMQYQTLKKSFKQILLNDIIQTEAILDTKFVDTTMRINNWSDKNSYIEHILMPRLNWLYDFDIITLDKNLSFSLTNYGKVLYRCLCNWNELAQHKIISAEWYVKRFFMKIFNEVYHHNKKVFTFAEEGILDMYLKKSFELFRTMAPNRTTFSLFANFAKTMMYFKHSIVIDENDIKEFYESNLNTKYIFKYQEQYKDGYLQKK